MISVKRKSNTHSSGQALVEFAIIIIFLSMLMFFIVDMARVGWAWATVQGAARAGARYASTGNASCQDPPSRMDCIIDAAFNYMDTLKLHEDPQAPWGSDDAYRIEVWGIDENNDGPWFDYPGAAGKPVVVRTYYWVPIITPFFRPIKANIPVYGQVTITNELFDSLGGASAGVGLPPPAPPIPAAQPTATFTPTPQATPTITPTATITPTNTPDPPPTSVCDTHFEGYLVAGDAFVNVTGILTSTVRVYDLTNELPSGDPRLLGTGALLNVPGHDCEGFATVPVSPTLISGSVISVVNDIDGSWDTDTVLAAPPTATPVPTETPTPTATPSAPYIVLDPACGLEGEIRFAVKGYNWNDSASPINLFWIENDGIPQLNDIILAGHFPDFIRIWSFPDVPPGDHSVMASSGSTIETIPFEVPCENPTDLVISNPIVADPPTQEHEPFEVQVVISNTGEIDANQQFFVDVYLDLTEIYTGYLPLNLSAGYVAVNDLAGGASKMVTVYVPDGFGSGVNQNRDVWAMVDSLQEVNELDEMDNIGGPLIVTGILTSTSPTPTPTSEGPGEIRGIIRASFVSSGRILPQPRAQVWLVDEDGFVLATTFSDSLAYYQFLNVADGEYDVWSCIPIDDEIYVGNRPNTIPTDKVADIVLIEEPLGCPY